MSWATTAPVLLARVSAIDGIGPCYLGDLHLRDEARVRQLFSPPGADALDVLRGARVVREQIAEEWWSTARTQATERYAVRLIWAVSGHGHSETDFQELIDRVFASLRDMTTIGSAHIVSRPTIGAIEYVEFGGFLAHSCDVSIELEELYTIAADAQPAQQAGRLNERSVYSDAANQIVARLAAVDASWKCHPFRPWGSDGADERDLFEAELVDDAERDAVRSWRMYRSSDSESDGLGRRVEVSTVWNLEGFLSWHDGTGSYDAFQRAVDAVRDMFRAQPSLGHAVNGTAVESGPLQVGEIGARALMGVLCHFADCRLPVEGVVHA